MKLNQATSFALQGATSGIAKKLSVFEENKSLIDDLDLLVIDPRKREVDYFNEKVREAVA